MANGPFDITLKLDSNHIDAPGRVKVSGVLRFLGAPSPPIIVFVDLYNALTNTLIESSRLLVGLPTPSVSITGGFGINAGGYEGTVNPPANGVYKVKAVFTGLPVRTGPVLAESEELKLNVGPMEWEVLDDASYNGQPTGSNHILGGPGSPFTAKFHVTHLGFAEKVYVGIAIARHKGVIAEDPSNIPQDGFFWQELSVGEDKGKATYSVEISGTFPESEYYQAFGTFDVLKFVAPAPPPPYEAISRMDDDWDKDVFDHKSEFKVSDQASYNGSPLGATHTPASQDELLTVGFTVQHRGSKEKIWVGFLIARARASGHGSPKDVPDEGYFSVPLEVNSDADWTDYPVEIVGTLPPGVDYYAAMGTFDVLRFTAATEPPPYTAVDRFDDDWDDDVLDYQSQFRLPSSAAYNGQMKLIKVLPNGEISCLVTVEHLGSGQRAYVGFLIARARATGHGSPNDVPAGGHFVQEYQFGENKDWTSYDIEVVGNFPIDTYYEEPGNFDSMRFVTDKQPPPWSGVVTLASQWDDDVFTLVGETPGVEVYTFSYQEV